MFGRITSVELFLELTMVELTGRNLTQTPMYTLRVTVEPLASFSCAVFDSSTDKLEPPTPPLLPLFVLVVDVGARGFDIDIKPSRMSAVERSSSFWVRLRRCIEGTKRMGWDGMGGDHMRRVETLVILKAARHGTARHGTARHGTRTTEPGHMRGYGARARAGNASAGVGRGRGPEAGACQARQGHINGASTGVVCARAVGTKHVFGSKGGLNSMHTSSSNSAALFFSSSSRAFFRSLVRRACSLFRSRLCHILRCRGG